MNELKEFNYEKMKIRVIQKEKELWFVLRDVCNIIKVGNVTDIFKRLDDDEKGFDSIDTHGGKQKVNIINESGLYNVLLRSDKPQAKPFRKWVTSEVLPTIRKTGGYINNEDQFISTYLSNADEQTKMMFKMTLQTVNNLNEKIEKDKPKVAFAEAVAYAEGNIKVGDAARIITQAGYKINQNKFYAYLRDHKYLQITKRSKNLPTHFSIVNDLIKIEEHVYTRNGKKHIRLQSVITPKGQRYFVARLVYGAPVNVEI